MKLALLINISASNFENCTLFKWVTELIFSRIQCLKTINELDKQIYKFSFYLPVQFYRLCTLELSHEIIDIEILMGVAFPPA